MKTATLAVHAGEHAALEASGDVAPAIHLSSTYRHPSLDQPPGFQYSRVGNPNRAGLEQALAELEGARFGLAFASGQAASHSVFSLVPPGQAVAVCESSYGGTLRLLDKVLAPRGLRVERFAPGDNAGLERILARGGVGLVWAESPTNPLLEIVDLAALAGLAHAHGALLAVDNTFATPALQNPLAMGADLVAHSTTKYLAGHSDSVGGAVLTSSEEAYRTLKLWQGVAGAVPGPFDSWLTLRGLRTLSLRMAAHSANALAVALAAQGHPALESVLYPGLAGHPGHALAARQMRGFSGIVTLGLKGGRAQASAFCRELSLFSLAESLGGVESLVAYPAAMSHAGMAPSERRRLGITDGTVRLSVGVEDAEDLRQDVLRALDKLAAGV